MADAVPKRPTRSASEGLSEPKGEEPRTEEKILLHPNREKRLKTAIKDLSANFPTARQRATDAILKLIRMLSGDNHKLDPRRAEELKIKLIRALAVLEAIHNRPETVSKEELESLKQAMILLNDVQLREGQMRPAGKVWVSKRPN